MQDHLGFTALMTACQEGHLDVSHLLIERGASIDRQNKVRLLLQCSMCIITEALSDTLIGVGIEEPRPLPSPSPQTMHQTDNIMYSPACQCPSTVTLAILYILMVLTHLACNKQCKKAAIERPTNNSCY